MSLITLPAFLYRRREDTPMPEVATEPKNDVVMRFRTQGGATVDLYRHHWTERRYGTATRPAQTLEWDGFNWTCQGCDLNGRGNDGWSGGYSGSYPSEARLTANEHASACWSMPKPQG